MIGVLLRLAVILGAGALVIPSAPASAAGPDDPGVLVVQTVPATPRARVAADGNIARTDDKGRAFLAVPHFRDLQRRFNVLSTRVSPSKKVTYDRILGNPDHGFNGQPVVVGLKTERLVRWAFVDRGGVEVPESRITSLTLRSSMGEQLTLEGQDLVRPIWLASSRTQQTPTGLAVKDIYWSVSSVIVAGAEVVNRGQQVYLPRQTQDWRISLLFYRVEFVGRDLLFGTLAGGGVELVRPGGEEIREPFNREGVAVFDRLPRAQYDVRVYGGGLSFVRPMSVSKDQRYEIEVITRFDVGLIASVVVLVAISLVAVGRRRQLARVWFRARTGGYLGVGLICVVASLVTLAVPSDARAAESVGGTAEAAPDGGLPPVFAYYYIWFQPTSWQRAKSDYPLLGRYSSDDPVVLRRHVTMAQEAGLTGFLVSWKDQDHLSQRLARLVKVAHATDFKLGIVYQGLDFERNPLPVPRIAADLTTFADRYADDEVFDTFERPVVIITGTEKFSVDELRRATEGVRSRVHVLASAKSPDEYERTAPVVDGDAYYWSSGDPRSPSHSRRLQEMSDAVHADRGLWLAPAAPGFDARPVGGRRVIAREGGSTLRAAFSSARSSDPDAIGVISWNEFSENSHVEPSRKYGTQELAALAGLLGGRTWLPPSIEVEERPASGLTGWGALLLLLLLLALLNFGLLAHQARRRPAPRHLMTGGTR